MDRGNRALTLAACRGNPWFLWLFLQAMGEKNEGLGGVYYSNAGE